LFRRGLNRGYKTFTDELVGPRGRLRLDRMIKEATQLRGTAICDFDELTHDVLHNQILKATLVDLATCLDVKKETRDDLQSLIRRFYDVEQIHLSASCFRRATASRNNRDYVFLMRLCEFVFRSLMPDARDTGSQFQQVRDEDIRKWQVFESFLRSFFRVNRVEYRVKVDRLEWCVSNATEVDIALLPEMQTDMTLRHLDHTIIIDAKFDRKALVRGHHGVMRECSHSTFIS